MEELKAEYRANGKRLPSDRVAEWKRLNQENSEAAQRLEEARKVANVPDFERPKGDQSRETFRRAMKAWGSAGARADKGDLEAARSMGIDIHQREIVLPMVRHDKIREIQRLVRGEKFGRPDEAQSRALNTIDIGAGGATVGETFTQSVLANTLAYGDILTEVDVINTTTAEPHHLPSVDDTSNSARIVGQNASNTTQADPTWNDMVLGAQKYTGDWVKVPFEFFRDSSQDIEALLGPLFGERMGRGMSAHATTGTGVNEPRGFTIDAATGKTSASSTAIAYSEVVNLEMSLDPSIVRPDTPYMFHYSILEVLRLILDGNSHPIFSANAANFGTPNAINGRRYVVNQSMASSLASGAKSMAIGNFMAYKWRLVGQMRLMRAVERYIENDQIGFTAFWEADGRLIEPGTDQIKMLVQV